MTAFVREKSGIGGKTGKDDAVNMFPNATVKFGSVAETGSIRDDAFGAGSYDVVVSCLASRTGGIKDSWDIDYQVRRTLVGPCRVH